MWIDRASSVRRLSRPLRHFVRRLGHALRDRTETSSGTVYTRRRLQPVDVARSRRFAGRIRASLLGHLAERLLVLRRWDTALTLAVRATQLAPTDPTSWIRLSRILRSAGPLGLAAHDVVGIVEERAGDLHGAHAAAELATALAPDDPCAWIEAGRSAAAAGESDVARCAFEAAIEVAPRCASAWYHLGRTYAEEAMRRGSFRSSDFDNHRRCLQLALDLEPGHAHARYHLIRVAERAGDWRTAAVTAEPSLTVGVAEVRDALVAEMSREQADAIAAAARTAQDGGTTVEGDLWLVAYWRLVTAGWTLQAYAARDAYARHLLDRFADDSTLSAGVEKIRAAMCLDDVERARSITADTRSSTRARRHLDILTKLSSDIDAFDPATAVSSYRRRRSVPPALRASERMFTEWIAGKRVVVVGPLSSGHDDRVVDADVVVSTLSTGLADGMLPHAFRTGGRLRIAYVANSTMSRYAHQLASLLDGGSIDLVVARPTAHRFVPKVLTGRGDVRFCPAENAALLQATPYAIPRIVHDILGHDPAKVTVVGSDLYLNGRAYVPGYQRARVVNVTPRVDGAGLELDELVDGYGHDLRADHRWFRSVVSAGLVHTSDVLAEVVALDEQAYLESVGVGHRHSRIRP